MESKTDLPYCHNVVDGLIVPRFVTQTRVDELKHSLMLCPGDVVVNTYSKSGTTWVQQIVKLLRSDGKEDGTTISDAIAWLDCGDGYPNYRPLENLTRPFYFKSHMPYERCPGGLPHTTQAKYIYVARNPKDVAVSYYHHMRAYKGIDFSGSWDVFFNLFLTGRVYFGAWFDHVLAWWRYQDRENILFLKYEDLSSNIREGVEKIAEFIFANTPPANVLDEVAKQCTFNSMKENPAANFSWVNPHRHPDAPPFLRKGTVGDWMNYFTTEQNAEFDAVYAEKMKDSRLDFRFQ